MEGERHQGKEEREIEMNLVAMMKSTHTCIYDINISLIQTIIEKEMCTYAILCTVFVHIIFNK